MQIVNNKGTFLVWNQIPKEMANTPPLDVRNALSNNWSYGLNDLFQLYDTKGLS